MTWTTALLRFFTDAFRPPFRTTHWVVLLYVIISFIFNPSSHFNHWTMPDTDDYTRLVQVLNWLDGQGWFDMRLPQLYPDHVISMHWSRMVDVPLAILITIMDGLNTFFRWNAPRTSVALLTACVMPCIMLVLFLKVARAWARPMLGKHRAGIICFMAVLSLQLMFQFMPMRVDHHAYILLGAGITFYALQNMALNVRPKRMALLAGTALGITMWNGAEILPMLIGTSFCLTVLMIVYKKPRIENGVIFGAALTLASLLVLLVSRAPDQRWMIAYDSHSFFHVLLSLYVLGFFVSLCLCACITRSRAVLLAFAFFASMVGIHALLTQFPDLMFGPYAKVNPILNQVFFPNISEAVPFFKAWQDLGDDFAVSPNQSIGGAIFFISTRLFAPVVAIITCLYQFYTSPRASRIRPVWMLYAFFVLFYTSLGMFWEIRVITYAQMFALAPLGWLMLRYLKNLQHHYSGRQLFAWEIVAVLSLTVFPTLLIPSILKESKLNPDIMFYLGNGSTLPCKDRSRIVRHLHTLSAQEKTATILAPMDYTPAFMMYTKHRYIAAPYHRNDRGIIDMLMFFRSTNDDRAARHIAKKLKLDYVLVCKKSPYQGTLAREMQRSPSTKADFLKTSLSTRLAKDKIPQWLEPVNIPNESEFGLYKVKQGMLNKP